MHINLLLLERNTLLEDINFLFVDNLNKYKHFDFINTFKIICNLLKISLPFNVKNLIKKLQNSLVTYVLFQSESFLFKFYLRGEEEILNSADNKIHQLEDFITPTIKVKILNYF